MSRFLTVGILAVLLATLGIMRIIVEKAGRPDPPKPQSATEAAARQQQMQDRMRKEGEERKNALAAVRDRVNKTGKGAPPNPGAVVGDDGHNEGPLPGGAMDEHGHERPPTNPADAAGARKALPPGSLDVRGDWYRLRKPGSSGIDQMQAEDAKNTAPEPKPSMAPATPRPK
jgi:hypothetical protein